MRYSSSRGDPDLRTIANDLARRLGGHPTSRGAMCRCPAHDDRSPSLSIRIGRSALLFKCFAGCDTDDVLRALLEVDDRVLGSRSEPTDDKGNHSRELALRERAREIWDWSVSPAGTAAQDYLAARGLALPPTGLRFNARTPLGGQCEVIFRPALIAALHDAGRLVAVQRCFLDGHQPRLACKLGNPRRLLGRPLGGAVVLGHPIDTLGLAEGVETALSAAVLLDVPVWATLGAERLAQITIPDRIERLLILPDNDRSGRIGAAKALEAYARPGRQIDLIWPGGGLNDWNDVLRTGQAA